MKKHFVYILAVIFALFNGTTYAQKNNANATISGKITDAQTGEPLIGATIHIENTNIGTFSGLNGEYTIRNLNQGNVSLKITYISYQSKRVENIQLKPAETRFINVSLEHTKEVLDAVTVVAAPNRDSEKAVIMKRRTSISVLDGISIEQMRRTGDYDAGEALKRLPGITVKSNKELHVRGMGSRYNLITLNGILLPGLDPDKKSVQTDLFPSPLIDNIEVHKTAKPDLPPFSGAYVNIITKDIPRNKIISGSYMTTYNTQATFNDDYLTFPAGKTNWLGYDDGTRSIPFYSQEELNDLMATLDYDKISERTKEYNTDIDFIQKAPFLNQRFNLNYGNSTNLFGKEVGYIISGSYKNSNYFYDDGLHASYDLFGNIEEIDQLSRKFEYNETKSKESVIWNGLLGLSMQLDPLKKISFNSMYVHSGETRAYLREGFSRVTENNFDGNTAVKARQEFVDRDMMSNQLSYDMQVSHNFPLKIKTDVAWSKATMDMPDLRQILFSYNDENNTREYDLYTKNDQYVNRVIRSLEENNYFGKADFSFLSRYSGNFNIKWKAGGLYLKRNRIYRDNKVNYWDSHKMGGAQYGFVGSIEEYLNNTYTGGADSGVYINNAYESRNNYDSDELNWAAYGMATLFVNGNWKFMGGARFAKTKIRFTSFDEQYLVDGTPLDDRLIEDRFDILPSVILSRTIKKDHIIRLAVSRTIDRPNMRERAPISAFDPANNVELIGNPELKTATINNIDLRYEWFLPESQIFALSAYYKYLQNPIEMVDVGGSDLKRIMPKNVKQAKVYGLEAEIRKHFGFIAPAFKPLSINMNAAIIESIVDIDEEELNKIRVLDSGHPSQRPLFFQAPWLLNASLIYEKNKLEATIAYNIQGKTVVLVNPSTPDVLLHPRHNVNFTIQYKIYPLWILSFQTLNIFNEPYYRSTNFIDREYVFGNHTKGTVFLLGITYKL